MSNQRKIVIILLIGLLSIIISIIPEILGDDAKALCEKYLGENYILYVVLFFIVGSLLLVFLTTDIREGIFPTKNKHQDKKASIDKSISEIRAWLLESYQKRLNTKMASRHPINLQLKYSLEGTTTKAPLYDNRTIRSKLIKEELISVFDKHRGRLLIIGEAGSGKTTLLLQLAVSLLEREIEIIPIIINIATWRERFNSIEDWLIELLPQMGLSDSLVETLIEENKLLPLFDGLDELAEENRKLCLEAIGKYGKINNLQYAICSRIVEYSQTVDAPVYCQIEVRPLTLTQIKNQLKKANTPESKGMLHAISNDKLLREVIKTPFYLNTAQILFSSLKTIDEFDFKATDIEGRKKEIVKCLIEESLSLISYPIKKSKHWLSFFAYEITQHHLVDFELANLQYNWSNWTKNSLIFAGAIKKLGSSFSSFFIFFLSFLIIGFFFIMFSNLVKNLSYDFIFYLIFGIAFSLIAAIICALISSLGKAFKLTLIYLKFRAITIGLIFTLITGLFIFMFLDSDLRMILMVSISIGMASIGNGTYITGSRARSNDFFKKNTNVSIYTSDTTNWSIYVFTKSFDKINLIILAIFFLIAIFSGFIVNSHLNFGTNLILSLFVFLYVGMAYIFINLFSYRNYNFLQLRTPYQRFIASIKNLHFSLLEHLGLRYQLYKKGLLPFRLVTFLNELTKQHLFESDGASWRFRHKILQDYFANLWENQKKEN